jgi:hypothetical protein
MENALPVQDCATGMLNKATCEKMRFGYPRNAPPVLNCVITQNGAAYAEPRRLCKIVALNAEPRRPCRIAPPTQNRATYANLQYCASYAKHAAYTKQSHLRKTALPALNCAIYTELCCLCRTLPPIQDSLRRLCRIVPFVQDRAAYAELRRLCWTAPPYAALRIHANGAAYTTKLLRLCKIAPHGAGPRRLCRCVALVQDRAAFTRGCAACAEPRRLRLCRTASSV